MKQYTDHKLGLLLIGGATLLAALAGASVTRKNRRWYHRLETAPLNPPDAVFGPVWTVLYGLSAVSAARVLAAPPSPPRSRALGLWGLQLLLNAAWTPLFFGAHRPREALLDLSLLWTTLLGYRSAARQVDPVAARLVAPYLTWVSFAGYLNEEVLRKNPPRRFAH